MRISLNGRPITGEGTEDEPPPGMHVIRRLVDATVCGVEAMPKERIRIRFKTCQEEDLTVEFCVHLEREPDGTTVELAMDVLTRNHPDPQFL